MLTTFKSLILELVILGKYFFIIILLAMYFVCYALCVRANNLKVYFLIGFNKFYWFINLQRNEGNPIHTIQLLFSDMITIKKWNLKNQQL